MHLVVCFIILALRQFLYALHAKHTVECIIRYKLKERNTVSLLARTVVMLSWFKKKKFKKKIML